MLIKENVVKFLQDSLRLQDPSTETDPAYIFTEDQLWDIVNIVTPAHSPYHTVDTLPDNEAYFVILLAKKEVYYRLATSTAPLYPLKAEGAELRKDFRFEHYMSLIRRVEAEYENSWDKFERGREVEVQDLLLHSKHYSERNYKFAHVPSVTARIVAVRGDSVDVEWSKFNTPRGLFWHYSVYVSTSPIYDEFEGVIDPSAKKVVEIHDIHKTKVRIKGLSPDTAYFILVVSTDANKLQGYVELETTTLGV